MQLVTRYMIDDITNSISKIRCRNEEEINNTVGRFRGLLIGAIFALREQKLIVYSDYRSSIQNYIDQLLPYLEQEPAEVDDVNTLVSSVTNALREYLQRSYSSNYNYSSEIQYGQEERLYIDDITMQMLTPAFRLRKERTVNILDPCCNTHRNLARLKRAFSKAATYAAAVAEMRAVETKKRIDKVALGPIEGTHISNNAFDVMIIQPKLLFKKSSYHNFTGRDERVYLKNSFKYLRPEGYIVVIIPYYRVYSDLRMDLSKAFEEIQIRRCLDFENTGNVIILGRKKRSNEFDRESFMTLRNMYNENNIPNIVISSFEPVYLPEEPEEINLFRGSLLDEQELQAIYDSSSAMKAFWNNQQTKPIQEQVGRPPLPFNEGRIGLVLASGVLDGIIDEGDGHSHIVKGRVVRRTESDSEVSDQTLQVTETESNRVEINALLPNGIHKVLV